MQKSLLSFSGIAVLAAILLVLNGISDAVFSRFYVDMTEDRLYSLSPGTIRILKAIEEPVTFRFYFSKTEASKYPGVKLYGTRIADLLREYERQSGGRVLLETYDPRPDTEEEEWAQKYGVTPLGLPTGEKLYIGLAAVNSIGEEDVIPVFDLSRQEFLEYDVTKLVYSLSKSEKAVVGVISPLALKGEPEQMPMPGRMAPPSRPWVLVTQLSKFAEVKFLPADASTIDPGIDLLLIVHPKNLGEQALYAIDQYLVKGGSAFIAVDPYCSVDQPKTDAENPMAAMTADRSSNLKSLMQAWGVKLVERKVVADIDMATKVSSGQTRDQQLFPVWLTLGSDAAGAKGLVNRSNIVTSQLENVMLAWPGALELSKVDGVTVESLLQTTDTAMLFDEQTIRFSGDNPDQILKDYQRGSQSYTLAVRIGGKLKSAFPGKPGEKQQENMSTADGHTAQGVKDANIIVIADVDFLADRYAAYVQQFLGTQIVTLINDNLVLAANAVENLAAGSADLISLRSRGKYTRPFTRVQAIEARAAEKWKLEEETLQAQLNEANRRLSQLQSGSEAGGDGKKVFTAALLGEIKKFREQRQLAQQRLREVRRKLREDKERLGEILFLINTFFIPFVLIVTSVVAALRKSRRPRQTTRFGESESNELIEESKA